MMKSVSAQTHLPNLTRDQFHAHYEDVHVPIAIQHFPFTGYVRNHVLGSPDVWFSTLTEFWAHDLAKLGETLNGPAGPIMADDEARFMQRDGIAATSGDERRLSEGAPTDERGERSLVLVRWDSAQRPEAVGALEDWARRVAAGQHGVSLDLLGSSFTNTPFPADALLWLPSFDAAPPPPSGLGVTAIRVRRCETPVADLLGHA